MAVPLRTGFEQPSFIVYEKDRGSYYAKEGRTGDIAYGGPNNVGGVSGSSFSAVLQAAINALTAGRTHPEAVAVKGSVTLDVKISVPGYTVLDLTNAKLTAKVSLNDNMIEATGYFFKIVGGILDGNKANNASGSCIRLLPGAQRWFIQGVRIINAKQHGIYAEGVEVNQVGVGDIEGNDVEDAGANGIFLGPWTADHLIRGNNIGGCSGIGILLSASYDNLIEHNLVWNNTGNGIDVYASHNNTVVGNRADYNGAHGINVEESNRNTVEGNTVHDNGSVSAGVYSGIFVKNANYNTVVGNKSWNTVTVFQGYGITESGTSDYNNIRDNEVSGNVTAGVVRVGGHTTVRGNLGYVNENQGIAVMAAGGAITVNHHMDEIPVVIHVTAQGDLGDVYVPGGDKITVTGFTIVADTPVAGVSVFWEAYAKSMGMWLFW